MAGWADSGSSRGRGGGGGGGGGGGFPNRGGANNMNTRWRARTPAQHQHQQHQHHEHQQHQHQQQHQQQQQRQHQQHQHQLSYRPVNGNDQSSQHLPAEEPNHHRGQGGFSNSTRRPQPTRPPQGRPISTDHKSPAPATNSDANANTSEPDDKARRNAANFECNVCFDMADDPVVTLCGHLFCWECLYQWLHVHSHHRECPVCKGQVADDAIIPIYGRGGSAASVHTAPPRPVGARVESSRQQQQQQAALDWHMVADDDDDSPIDELGRLRYHLSSLSAMMSFMPDLPVDSEAYDFDTPYYQSDYDQLYDITGFAAYATAGAGSSRRHGHHTGVSGDTMETIFESTNHREADLFYPDGRRQHGRARGAASPERYDIIDLPRGTRFDNGGRNSVSYRDTGAGPHNNNTGRSSRPNGGWTERRGRSNRNSNSGGGRGPHNNSRRQGANYH